MADDSNSLGDLSVNIVGDDSELQGALDDALKSAETAGEGIAEAFTEAATATAPLETSVDSLVTNLDGLIAEQQELQDTFQQALSVYNDAQSAFNEGAIGADVLASALEQLSSAASDSGNSLGDFNQAASETKTVADEAGASLTEMAAEFAALAAAREVTDWMKEFVSAAVEVYGETQQVVTSFELLGQSSEEAEQNISKLSDMSLELAVPFESLERSARSLTVALQGVEGIDIDTVLTAAANSAALSGRSFDQVTAALQRVEVTGAVTSKQLLQLGVTWQQLADTAGTSVDAIQALLKKGGQDATADLQLVIDTVNSMALGAAEAQAQTVKGQIQILTNEVTLLFDQIGQDIAPTVTTIVSALSSLINVARDAAVEFQALPQPVKDLAVGLGLVAAATVPLVAAFAVLGIGLNAIAEVGPAVERIMGTLGIAAAEDATAETAAAVATAAHGAAAGAAIPELEGLTVAEGEAGAAASTVGAGFAGFAALAPLAILGLAGVASGAHTVVESLSSMHDTLSEITQNVQDGGGAITTFGQTLDRLGIDGDSAVAAIQNVTSAIRDVTPSINTLMSGAWTSFVNSIGVGLPQASTLAAAAFQKLAISLGLIAPPTTAAKAALDALANAAVPFSQTAQDVAKNVQTLQDNVRLAQLAVTEYTIALEDNETVGNGAVSTADLLAAAEAKLASAQKALNTAIGTTNTALVTQEGSIEQIAASLAKAQNAWQNAQNTVDQLNQKLEAGETTIGGWNIETELIPAAVKAAEAAWNSFQKQIDGTTTSIKNHTDAVQKDAQTVDTVSDSLKKWQGSVNDFMGPLQTEITVINGAGQAIATYAQAGDRLATVTNNLTGISGTFKGALVDVAATAGTAAASIAVLKGNSDSAAQTFDSLETSVIEANGKIVYLTGSVVNNSGAITDATKSTISYMNSMQDAADGADNLVVNINDLTQSATDAVGATNDEADALLALAAAADDAADAVTSVNTANSRSGSGKGDSQGSLGAYLADAISVAQNPALGGAIGGGGIGQGYIDKMAQELADATGQVVTTLDGQFIPAAQQAATLAAALAKSEGAASTATDSNTTATNTNTKATNASTTATNASATATNASTAATGSATSSVTDLAYGVQQTTDAAGDVTLAIQDSTGTITDWTESAADAKAGANTFTTSVQPTIQAVIALHGYLADNGTATGANTKATADNTTAVGDATTGVGAMTKAIGDATDAASSLATTINTVQGVASNHGPAGPGAQMSPAELAWAGGNVQPVDLNTGPASVGGTTSNLGPVGPGAQMSPAELAWAGGNVQPVDLNTGPASVGGTTMGNLSGQYVNPNPGLMTGVANIGGAISYPSESPSYPSVPSSGSPVGGGVTLNVTVTGNFAASDQSIQQLANKVGSAMTTQLRTLGGLKL